MRFFILTILVFIYNIGFCQSKFDIHPRLDVYDLVANPKTSQIGHIKEVQLQEMIEHNKVSFTKPKDFHHYSLGLVNWVDCKQGEAINDYFLTMLANRDSSVLIGICIWNKGEGLIRWNKKTAPHREENWKARIAYNADTLQQPVRYYPLKYLTEKYRADVGGEYKLRCTPSYHGDYKVYKLFSCINMNGEVLKSTIFPDISLPTRWMM